MGQSTQTLSPDLATGTAAFARKQTGAAELTQHPATPVPAESLQAPTIVWTPSGGEIVASNSGQTFDIGITSRISIILNQIDYPPANLQQTCVPADALGQVSNIPVVPPNFYVVRYEGVEVGQCVIRNGSFEVTINVISNP